MDRVDGGSGVGINYKTCFEKIGVIVDKLSDTVYWLLGAIASITAWIVKRLFGRIDTLEERVDTIECTQLTKEDLDSSLEPIRDTNTMILTHLLEHRRTEYGPDKLKIKEIKDE